MSVRCWTDASIVLHWLNNHPVKWKTFVANRVAEIQTLLPGIQWSHVPSEENPADLASRGVSAHDLPKCKLWFEGPKWLSRSRNVWPRSLPGLPEGTPLEERVSHVSSHHSELLEHLTLTISTWSRFLRIIAYILRWRQCLSGSMNKGSLTSEELHRAEVVIFRWLQSELFPQDVKDLRTRCGISKKSSLRSLAPYLDEDGIIRVGGRLKNSDLPLHAKHPIILRANPIVRLLIIHTHLRCLHGGLSLTLHFAANCLGSPCKKIIRSVIFKCVTCARVKAELSSETMGNLPASRITRPDRPFSHCRVDYAGPIRIRLSKGRGRTAQTAYIALFVCFAVKAIHIEIVSDYSSSAFIAVFKRFSSRRGLPNCMYSDRGTTFVGAHTELSGAFQNAIESEEFRDILARDGVSWRFLPPAAPHFGGLWEAGVKSVKFHLTRILGDHTPTFEELSTLLCEIEAALNSRPLGPLTEDIDNLKVLTPGHFLTGGPLNAVPEGSLMTRSVNCLSRWQLYRQMFERFWQLWSSDYLLSLQHRTKWHIAKNPISVGQLVLVKRPNMPPTKWPLARVITCIPGKDDVVRVVKLRTATSSLTRPVTQLSLLPIDVNKS